MGADRPTNLAIMGIGTIGKRHLMAIEAIDTVNVCGVVDISEEAKSYCENRNIPIFHNLNELKNNQNVDGVVISTPTVLHHKNALSALDLGFDVLIEKPISANFSQAEEIKELANKKKCMVLVGHQRRFNPLVIKAKEIISENKIGIVVGLSGVWALRKDKEYFAPDWRKKITAGPVITNLIHDIDYLRFIFGEILEVSAYTSNKVNNFEKEDILSVNFKFESGLLGNFLITDSGTSPWAWETGTKENIHLPHLSENNLRIIGTDGSLEFPNLIIWKYKIGGKNWKNELEKVYIECETVDPYISQINHFTDVICRKVKPITDASEGKQNLKIALSILESSKKNCIVKI